MVVVPRVKGDVVAVYARLRAVGLRVSISRGWSFDSLRPPRVARMVPAAGRRVQPGSVVRLYLSCCQRVPGPRVPGGRLPRFVVPRFAGGVVSSAYAWTRQHRLDFRAYLGPLKAGAESGLFANYRVSRQRPAAGARLAVGERTRAAKGKPGRFRRTPLTVWGTQPPPCTPPPGYTVTASNTEAVLTSHAYEEPAHGGAPGPVPFIGYYGCLRAVGSRRQLTSAYDYPAGALKVLGKVLLAGHFAAFLFDTSSRYSCSQSVEIYDLNTGKPGQVFTKHCEVQGGTIDSLVASSGGFAAWHTTDQLPPTGITGMSCPSVSVCVATDSAGNVLTSTSPSGGRPAWTISRVAGRGLGGVSCPTENFCVATAGSDIYTSTDPTGGSAAWTVTHTNGIFLDQVSCPSTSLCVITATASGTVAITPMIVSSTDPTGGAAAWSATRIAVPEFLEAISCPSTSLCVAGGVPNVGTRAASIVTSTDPTGHSASAWTATTGFSIDSVSCPSTHLCLAGSLSAGAVLSSTNPTGGANAWTTTQIPSSAGVQAMSCPSTTLCVAGSYGVAGSHGNMIWSTNPTGGANAWTATPIPRFGAVDAISCPSTTLCVAGNGAGQILTTTNPSGPSDAWSIALVDAPPTCNSLPCVVEHVYAHATHGTQVLDTSLPSARGAITKLQLSGNQLTWNNSGAPHHATLH